MINYQYGWLSGDEIRKQVECGNITIDPFNTCNINPNSYNYTLYKKLKILKNEIIDLKGEDQFEEIEISESGILLYPNELYLGATNEIFGSNHFASLITGRSSIGRKFVTNHKTAGLIDVGFYGRITLEIQVARKTLFYPNIKFGQIFWFTIVGNKPQYNGKYLKQEEPTISKIFLD